MTDHHLEEEAEAFDEHARTRLKHGHIADLRRTQPCDWFYNNPWRRPYLADMVFGRYFRFGLANATGHRLLEVGSGLGHMALEFARHGFEVSGIDLSGAAVAAARETAEQNPFQQGFGSVNYLTEDYLTWQPPDRFDTVCFFGALHHFEDVRQVVSHTRSLINPGGRVVVIEPARDWPTQSDGAIIALIRLLLATQGGWYEAVPLPRTVDEFSNYANECLREYQEARDQRDAAQSPHDNAAFAADMLAALREQFDEITFEPGFSFFPRMGGGIRAESEERAKEMAEFLYGFDQYAVANKLMNAGGFLWAGKRS